MAQGHVLLDGNGDVEGAELTHLDRRKLGPRPVGIDEFNFIFSA